MEVELSSFLEVIPAAPTALLSGDGNPPPLAAVVVVAILLLCVGSEVAAVSGRGPLAGEQLLAVAEPAQGAEAVRRRLERAVAADAGRPRELLGAAVAANEHELISVLMVIIRLLFT